MFKRIRGGLQERRKREKFRVFKGCMNRSREQYPQERKKRGGRTPRPTCLSIIKHSIILLINFLCLNTIKHLYRPYF